MLAAYIGNLVPAVPNSNLASNTTDSRLSAHDLNVPQASAASLQSMQAFGDLSDNLMSELLNTDIASSPSQNSFDNDDMFDVLGGDGDVAGLLCNA